MGGKNTVENSFFDKFFAKIKHSSGCWLWAGYINKKGYGQLGFEGKICRAHRVSYEFFVGPLIQGLVIDHLCNNPSCVNPFHLNQTTNKENVARGTSPTAQNKRKKVCLKGHPLIEENVYKEGDGRKCITCRKNQKKQWEKSKTKEELYEYRKKYREKYKKEIAARNQSF
jgi:hypothetical protein